MSSSLPQSNEDYTVGWVCALPIELAAARGILDESYGKPTKQDSNDKNCYELGRIGKHNVVIACLPKGVYGTTSAATVATRMLSTFRSIRFGLMVGVGGGVPSREHDIRLGDVVVSTPGKTFGGVVQYDYGKAIAPGGGMFEQTGVLNKPPVILLAAIASLEADQEIKDSRIPEFLEDMVLSHPKMKDAYSYQGRENDQLFRAEYTHVDDDSVCESCDVSQVVERTIVRNNNDPVVHYGVIASGNQVVKDRVKRDQWRKELDVLCFEMEAAGLMDNFPCLIIRGICDYADSHKNKRWQRYTAATAAVYAKELLSIIPQDEVACIRTAFEATNQLVKHAVDKVDNTIDRIARDLNHEKIANWLLPKGYDSKHKIAIEKHVTGTGEWFMNDVRDWLQNATNRSIFLVSWYSWGWEDDPNVRYPDIDQTSLMKCRSTTIQYIQSQAQTYDFSGVAYVYFDRKEHDIQTTAAILANILGQLAYQVPSLWPPLEQLYGKHKNGKETLMASDLWEIITGNSSRIFLAFDALDEASPATQDELLKYIQDLSPSRRHVFLTSRPDISLDRIPGAFLKAIEAHESDLRKFVQMQIGNSRRLREILEHSKQKVEEIGEEIVHAIISRTNGMFLLVAFQVKLCEDSRCIADIRKSVRKIPNDRDGIYDQTWTYIHSQLPNDVSLATRVLSWICLAKRNLSIEELKEAIAIENGAKKTNIEKLIPDSLLISVCKGLVFLDENDQVVRLAHATVQDYLSKKIDQGEEPEMCSLEIASSCLTYLSYDDFSKGPCRGWEALMSRLRENVFLSYAVTYFSDHAREVKEKNFLVERLVIFARHNNLRSSFLQVFYYYNIRTRRLSINGRHNALHFLTLINNVDATEKILEQVPKREINQMDQKAGSPLCLAAEHGHDEIVRLLLDNGADINVQGEYHENALYAASARGHGQVVQRLLNNGADVDAQGGYYGRALYAASARGYGQIVQRLLNKGANVNAQSGYYGSALYAASTWGHDQIVQRLLDKGADVNAQGGYYGGALEVAPAGGHDQVLQRLLDKGADFNAQGGYYGTALQVASARSHDQVVQRLLDNGADVNAQGGYYGSALQVASARGHDQVVQRLFENGADIDAQCREHGSALQAASVRGQDQIVRRLLERGRMGHFVNTQSTLKFKNSQ